MAWKIASFFPISNLFAGEYSFKFAFVNCSRTRKEFEPLRTILNCALPRCNELQ
jgi:hypothetical protein